MTRQSGIDPKLLKLLGRISDNIERLRKTKGWTQAKTAEEIGGDLRWYQRLESGKYVLSLETLVRLSELFRIDVRELFR